MHSSEQFAKEKDQHHLILQRSEHAEGLECFLKLQGYKWQRGSWIQATSHNWFIWVLCDKALLSAFTISSPKSPQHPHYQWLPSTPTYKVCLYPSDFFSKKNTMFHNSWIQLKADKYCSHRAWTVLLKSFSWSHFSSRSYTVGNSMGSIWNISLYLL